MARGFLGNPAQTATVALVENAFLSGARATQAEEQGRREREERALAAKEELRAKEEARRAAYAQEMQKQLQQTRFDTINDQTTAVKQSIGKSIDYWRGYDTPDYDSVTRLNAAKKVAELQGNYGKLDQWRMRAQNEVFQTGGLAQPVFPEGLLGSPTAEPEYSAEKKEAAAIDLQTKKSHALGADLENKVKLSSLLGSPGNDKIAKSQESQGAALNKVIGDLTSNITSLRAAHQGYGVYGGETPESQLREANANIALGVASQVIPGLPRSMPLQADVNVDDEEGARQKRMQFFTEKIQPAIGKVQSSWAETLGLLQSGLMEDLIPGASNVMSRAFNTVGDYYSPEGAQKFNEFIERLGANTADPDAGAAKQIFGRLAPLRPMIAEYSTLGKFYNSQRSVK